MKKLILFVLISVSLFNMESNAQTGLQAGILVQPSLVSMRSALFSFNNDYDPDYNQTLRTSAGLYLDYHFSDMVGVGINILYAAQGQKFFVNGGDSNKYESHFYKFNYIKIPIFLSYNSGGSKARLIGTVGPQLLVLASAKDKYKSKDIDVLDSYAPLNLGFNFGIGIGFFLTRNTMLSIAPNFDIAFLNYNYTTDEAQPAYISKSPISTSLGLQVVLKYVKNEVAPDTEIIRAN